MFKNYIITALLLTSFIAPSCFAKTILLSMSANTNKLRYTENDNNNIVNAFKRFYVRLYNEEIIVYPLLKVTKNNYKSTINRIKKIITPQDHLIVYFSGHGTTIFDMNHDEKDGLDEALITYNHKKRITKDLLIIDDDLSRDLKWLNPDRLTLILDTCLSAGMQKSLGFSNKTSTSINKYSFNDVPRQKTQQTTNIFALPEGTRGILDGNIKGELFAASSDGEDALEYDDRNVKGGIFTFYFVQALNQVNTIDVAFNHARGRVISATKNQQTPRRYNY